MAIYQKIYLVVHPMLSPNISTNRAHFAHNRAYLGLNGPLLGLIVVFLTLSGLFGPDCRPNCARLMGKLAACGPIICKFLPKRNIFLEKRKIFQQERKNKNEQEKLNICPFRGKYALV